MDFGSADCAAFLINSLFRSIFLHRKTNRYFRRIWIGPQTAKLIDDLLFVLDHSPALQQVLLPRGHHHFHAKFVRLLWYPLYTFSRRGGHSPEDAQDLTQSFFCTCWNMGPSPTSIGLKGSSGRSYWHPFRTTFQSTPVQDVASKGAASEFIPLDLEKRRESLSA